MPPPLEVEAARKHSVGSPPPQAVGGMELSS